MHFNSEYEWYERMSLICTQRHISILHGVFTTAQYTASQWFQCDRQTDRQTDSTVMVLTDSFS